MYVDMEGIWGQRREAVNGYLKSGPDGVYFMLVDIS